MNLQKLTKYFTFCQRAKIWINMVTLVQSRQLMQKSFIAFSLGFNFGLRLSYFWLFCRFSCLLLSDIGTGMLCDVIRSNDAKFDGNSSSNDAFVVVVDVGGVGGDVDMLLSFFLSLFWLKSGNIFDRISVSPADADADADVDVDDVRSRSGALTSWNCSESWSTDFSSKPCTTGRPFRSTNGIPALWEKKDRWGVIGRSKA